MAKSKVTEEDLRLTEALIARSFLRVKATIANTPTELLTPAKNTIKEHPIAATATAAGAGLIIYEIIKMASPKPAIREVPPARPIRTENPGTDIKSQIVTAALPYVASYLQQEIGRYIASKEKR
ncbi:MAG TPA: hypothetical protein VK436_01280 [Methanocella sp.]|nr:hypothetical protein [Methanocella sp.]